MKPIATYILIADGARTRLLRVDHANKALLEVNGSEASHALKPDHDIGADRPGRVHESATIARHAIEHADYHAQEKEVFAKIIAQNLDRRLAAQEFERLIVVAPPEMMGYLRASFSDKVKAAIVSEVMKDLTKTPNPEVASHLQNELVL